MYNWYNVLTIATCLKEENMKAKRQSKLLGQQNQVKHDSGKVQTFIWSLNGVEKEVCLAGDFNNWKPEPMAKCGNEFKATVKMQPGLYQYKFIVDGQWIEDPCAKESVQNEYGTLNSVLQV